MHKPLVFLLACLAAIEASASPTPRTILVLPFESKNPRADIAWLSESFADTLSSRLAGNGRVALGRTERDLAYHDAGLPLGIPITRASALKVAQSLGANWLVTGTFTVNGTNLKATSILIDVDRLREAGPFEVSGQLAELADIETGLAWRMLAMQDPSFTVGSEEDFRRQFPPIRLDAHENYVRGIMASDPEKRLGFLTEASRRDPSDHRAAIELGRFYYQNKDYENSAKWLGKLAGDDADQLDVRFMRGVDEFFLGKEPAAQKTFSDLSRDAPIAEVWNNLGFLQSHAGRWVDAIASFDRAYQAEPSDPDFSFNLSVCMWNLKRYDIALRYLREGLLTAPDDPEVHRLLREVFGATGDNEGKRKEEQWLGARHEGVTSGGAPTLLPNPRLKKSFNWRAYRAWLQMGHPAREANAHSPLPSAEAKP